MVERDINKEIDLLSHIDQSYTEPFFYSRQCHEAVLAFGYALNKTVASETLYAWPCSIVKLTGI